MFLTLFTGSSDPIWKKTHRCNFIDKSNGESKRCGLVFPSKNKLVSHKAQANHLQRKRKLHDVSKVAASEPKQLRLEDVFSHQNEASDDDNEEEQDVCNLCMTIKTYSFFVYIV